MIYKFIGQAFVLLASIFFVPVGRIFVAGGEYLLSEGEFPAVEFAQ